MRRVWGRQGPSRRELLTGLGGIVAGAAAVGGVQSAVSTTRREPPLSFYGGYASAIRPDLHGPEHVQEDVVWGVRTMERVVALTFDDGPRPDWTPRVLETLAEKDVPATFFLRGDNTARYGALHEHDDGRHEYGNHTWDHQDLGRLDLAACTAQLTRCTQAIHDAYGIRPSLFRPPYGHLGGAALLAADQAAMTTVLWSAQFREASFVDDPAGIVGDVLSLVRPGAIVLGHDTGSPTRLVAIDHLGEIIDRLRDEGYRFATVSGLIASAPPDPARRTGSHPG